MKSASFAAIVLACAALSCDDPQRDASYAYSEGLAVGHQDATRVIVFRRVTESDGLFDRTRFRDQVPFLEVTGGDASRVAAALKRLQPMGAFEATNDVYDIYATNATGLEGHVFVRTMKAVHGGALCALLSGPDNGAGTYHYGLNCEILEVLKSLARQEGSLREPIS